MEAVAKVYAVPPAGDTSGEERRAWKVCQRGRVCVSAVRGECRVGVRCRRVRRRRTPASQALSHGAVMSDMKENAPPRRKNKEGNVRWS